MAQLDAVSFIELAASIKSFYTNSTLAAAIYRAEFRQ